jgi:hypothetical protein
MPDRQELPTMRHIPAFLASTAIVIAASVAAAPAFAADDMGSNPITELFDSFGMGTKEKPDIDYKERAPLVPPSSTAQLPPPQEKAAGGDGQWPNDPDVQRRQEIRARANIVPTETNEYRMGERGSRLDPDEIGARRVRGAAVSDGPGSATIQDNTVTRLSREELAQKRSMPAPTDSPSAASRQRLSDPPPGYLAGPAGQTAEVQPESKGFFGRMFGR